MTGQLPEAAYAVALSLLPGVGPARLRDWMYDEAPSRVWATVADGYGRADLDVGGLWRRHMDLGLSVLLPDHASYPERLIDDPRRPPILFCLGDPGVLSDKSTVAIVGTRSPTRYGIGVAAQLGADLAAAGVSVVSGLALGIDTAAHEGALDAGAPPIAVVAGGLDEPYPRRNTRLWERVASVGAIVSEAPAGGTTEKWRFPVRNRLMAALSDAVVVVESRHHGGARHTVDAALERQGVVGAVPGSIRSATSEFPNAILGSGAFPVCSAGDVLVGLALRGADVPPPSVVEERRAILPEDVPERDRALYQVLAMDPVSLDDLVRTTGLELAELCGGLERLAQAGMARDLGGWWERV